MHNIDIMAQDVMNPSSEWIVNAPRENTLWTQALDDATKGSYRKNHQGNYIVAWFRMLRAELSGTNIQMSTSDPGQNVT